MTHGRVIPDHTKAGLLPASDVLAALLAKTMPVGGAEIVALADVRGRVAIDAVDAPIALPPFDQSAVDGFGIAGAAPWRLVGAVAAGGDGPTRIGPGQAVRLLTGAAVPPGVEFVVASECTRRGRDSHIIADVMAPGTNIRRAGEDVLAGSQVVSPDTRFQARHVALLAALGIMHVAVRRRIVVGLLSTGDELQAPGTALLPRRIHDSNRPMMAALLSGATIVLRDIGVVRDDAPSLAAAFAGATNQCDLVVSTGGAGGSEADHVLAALRLGGGTARAWRLALKPGKPLVTGSIGATHYFGLPRNPLAALVATLLFVRPVLDRLAGAPAGSPPLRTAVAVVGWAREPGREEWVPVRIVGEDAAGLPLVERAGRSGSARLAPLAAADGMLVLPPDAASIAAGDLVRVHFFSSN